MISKAASDSSFEMLTVENDKKKERKTKNYPEEDNIN